MECKQATRRVPSWSLFDFFFFLNPIYVSHKLWKGLFIFYWDFIVLFFLYYKIIFYFIFYFIIIYFYYYLLVLVFLLFDTFYSSYFIY